jgi:murein DD-endopeptidase MepM/ murein hydrolase activator NlpD
VGQGQSAAVIARELHVPVEDVVELNDLASADAPLPPGTRLFVPEVPAAGSAEAKRPALVMPSGQRFGWPLASKVGILSSAFGIRDGKPHEGIDLAAPKGSPIYAAADGEVVYSGNGIRGYGNVVILRHDEGFLTVYAHNAQNRVQKGERVQRGQIVGEVGETGHATAPHLHFEVRFGEKPRNPLPFLQGIP